MVKQKGTEAMSVVRGAHCVVPFLVPLLTIKLNYYHMLNCCGLFITIRIKEEKMRLIYYYTFSLFFFSIF